MAGRRQPRRGLIIGCSALLAIGLVIVLAAAAAKNQTNLTTAPAGTSAPTPSPQTPATPAPIAAPAAAQKTQPPPAQRASRPAAAAPASAPTTPPTTANPAKAQAAALTAWWGQYGQSLTADFVSKSEAISAAAGAYDTPGMVAACGEHAAVVQRALNSPAPPVAEVGTHWRAAMTLFKASDHDCVQGGENLDAAQITQAATEANQGAAEIDQATAAVQRVTANL
jgi:hypothetical protein